MLPLVMCVHTSPWETGLQHYGQGSDRLYADRKITVFLFVCVRVFTVCYCYLVFRPKSCNETTRLLLIGGFVH